MKEHIVSKLKEPQIDLRCFKEIYQHLQKHDKLMNQTRIIRPKSSVKSRDSAAVSTQDTNLKFQRKRISNASSIIELERMGQSQIEKDHQKSKELAQTPIQDELISASVATVNQFEYQANC